MTCNVTQCRGQDGKGVLMVRGHLEAARKEMAPTDVGDNFRCLAVASSMAERCSKNCFVVFFSFSAYYILLLTTQ